MFAINPGLASAEPIPVERGPFAVVELFTSEGCSSCPPAEANLNRLHREATKADRRVFVLAFHVDYWDRLGWADPFSDAAYSERQRNYARTGDGRVYTPQMIVNGREPFVGSRTQESDQRIAAALRIDPPVGVGLAASRDDRKQTVTIDWRIDPLPEGAELQLALVEDGLSTDVPKGENRGLTLRHDGVVRAFKTINPDTQTGQSTFTLNKNVDPKETSVVAFVQDRRTREILAAHRIAIKP